jgi:hypothetical protein
MTVTEMAEVRARFGDADPLNSTHGQASQGHSMREIADSKGKVKSKDMGLQHAHFADLLNLGSLRMPDLRESPRFYTPRPKAPIRLRIRSYADRHLRQ